MKKALLLIGVILFIAIFGTAIIAKADYYISKYLRNNVIEKTEPTPAPAVLNTQNITAPVNDKITATNGFTVYDFAPEVTNARDLQVSPNGVLLVSQTSPGKVVALPDSDQNGQADEVKVVLDGLIKPHGLAFYNGQLFVAEEDKVSRYTWDEQTLSAVKEKELFYLPWDYKIRHFTRGLEFDQQGNLYISIGSTCNTCVEPNEQFASVMVTNVNGDSPRVFSKGLRNAVFIKVNPQTNQIWATEMSRDYLGPDIPVDEIDILKDGAHYGWPYCYGDQVKDETFTEGEPIDCALTEKPTFGIPAHAAPLGLTFIDSPYFPSSWQGDLLVAYHGSNQETKAGYSVVRQIVEGDQITGEEDFLTGFLGDSKPGAATTRPADVEFDKTGNLYVSDDKAGKVYLVTRTK